MKTKELLSSRAWESLLLGNQKKKKKKKEVAV